MRAVAIIKLAAGLHVGLAAAAIYYTIRINNHAELSAISAKEYVAMAGVVLLPVLFAWTGLQLARTDGKQRLLAAGQVVAMLLFAATFVLVVRSFEPMAPLLFVLVSLWLAAGLLVLLFVVWLLGWLAR